MEDRDILTISEAALILQVSRQAIHQGLMLGKYKATRPTSYGERGEQWSIDRKSMVAYYSNRLEKLNKQIKALGGK